MCELKAMLSVLISPKATFERIRDEGGHFVLPFLAVLLIAVVTILLNMPLLEYQAGQFGQMEVPGAEPIDPQASLVFMVIGGAVAAVAGSAIAVFLGGLLLMIINLVVRGEAKYMELVKVALFSSIPGLIQGLIFAGMTHVMNPADIMTMTFSLADLVSFENGFLRGLAALFNPFSLWGLALMVIGTAVMARQKTKRVAVWLIAGWLLLRLASLWFASLFSAFGTM